MMGIRVIMICALIGLSSSSSVGQDSAQYRACTSSTKSQTELDLCASEEAKRVDIELNTVYAKLLAKLSDDKNAVAKTKAAERAWIAYRDAYIDAMYPDEDKQAAYGTIFPMEVDLLRARLTREQIRALLALDHSRN